MGVAIASATRSARLFLFEAIAGTVIISNNETIIIFIILMFSLHLFSR